MRSNLDNFAAFSVWGDKTSLKLRIATIYTLRDFGHLYGLIKIFNIADEEQKAVKNDVSVNRQNSVLRPLQPLCSKRFNLNLCHLYLRMSFFVE